MFWSLAGVLVARLLSLASAMLVARILGRATFGELGMLQSTVGLFGVLAGFGMGLTSTKFVAEFRRTDPFRVGHILALSTVLSWLVAAATGFGLCVMAPFLARRYLANPPMADDLRIAALLLALSALNGQQNGTLSGLEAFRRITVVNLISGIASFPILILAALWGGLTGAMWGLVLSQAFTWLITQGALRAAMEEAGLRLTFRGCWGERRVLWTFSLPAVLAAAMVAPVNWFCLTLLIGRPSGYAEMGLFNAANQWLNSLLFIPSVVGQAALPILAERLGARHHDQAGRVLLGNLIVNTSVLVPLALGGAIVSPWLMGLYGADFRAGWPTLVIVLATAVLTGIQTPVGQVLIAGGRLWLGFLMNLGWAVIFVLGTLLWVERGALGVALARLCAYVAHSVWTFAYAHLFIRRHRQEHAT